MQFVFLLVRVLLAIIKEFVGVDILRHVPSVDVLIVICGFGYEMGVWHLLLFLILFFYRLFIGVIVMVIVEIMDQNHIFVYNLFYNLIFLFIFYINIVNFIFFNIIGIIIIVIEGLSHSFRSHTNKNHAYYQAATNSFR